MWHFRIRKYFSAYLDGELDEVNSRKIEDHLRSCAACRRELEHIREGKEWVSHLEVPEWAATERLWESMRSQLFAAPQESTQPGFGRRAAESVRRSRPISLLTRPAFASLALALLLVANILVTLQTDQPQYQLAAYDWMSNYVFDYGLYLGALSEGRPPTAFEKRYESQPTSYAAARDALPFRLASFSHRAEEAEEYELTDVRLLRNACCHSVQCTIRKDSQLVVIFQQPKEHPFAFGDYPLERTYIAGRWYHKAVAGSYQAISWVGSESKFVAIGESIEGQMAAIINAVGQ